MIELPTSKLNVGSTFERLGKALYFSQAIARFFYYPHRIVCEGGVAIL